MELKGYKDVNEKEINVDEYGVWKTSSTIPVNWTVDCLTQLKQPFATGKIIDIIENDTADVLYFVEWQRKGDNQTFKQYFIQSQLQVHKNCLFKDRCLRFVKILRKLENLALLHKECVWRFAK